MSGLRAEKRMDKNGKLVTRHIQYDGRTELPKKKLPSVFNMFAPDDRFPGATKQILDKALVYVPGPDRKRLMKTMNDDTMRALHAAGVGTNDNGNSFLDAQIGRIISICRQEENFALLNSIAFFANEDFRTLKLEEFSGVVKGLDRYQPNGAARIDYTTASDEEIDEARKLLTASARMYFRMGSFVKNDFSMYTCEGGAYIKSPLIVEAIRGMDMEGIDEFITLIEDRNIWFRDEADAKIALDMFALSDETHDALDGGIL